MHTMDNYVAKLFCLNFLGWPLATLRLGQKPLMVQSMFDLYSIYALFLQATNFLPGKDPQ